MNDDQENRTGSIVRVPGSNLTVVGRSSLVRRGLELLCGGQWDERRLLRYGKVISPLGAMYGSLGLSNGQRALEITNVDPTKAYFTLSAPDVQWYDSCSAWSPCGRYLITYESKGRLRVFDVQERRIVKSFGCHASGVDELTWSPSGDHIVTSSFVGEYAEKPEAKLWRCIWGQHVVGMSGKGKAKVPQSRDLLDIELAGEVTAVCGYPQRVKDERDGQLTNGVGLLGEGQVSPDDRLLTLLVGVCTRRKLEWPDQTWLAVLTVPELKECWHMGPPDLGGILDVRWAPDSESLLLGIFDGDVLRMFVAPLESMDLRALSSVEPVSPYYGHLDSWSAAVHPFLPLFAYSYYEHEEDRQELFVIDPVADYVIDRYEILNDYPVDMHWSADGRMLYAITYYGTALLYRVPATYV